MQTTRNNNTGLNIIKSAVREGSMVPRYDCKYVQCSKNSKIINLFLKIFRFNFFPFYDTVACRKYLVLNKHIIVIVKVTYFILLDFIELNRN